MEKPRADARRDPMDARSRNAAFEVVERSASRR